MRYGLTERSESGQLISSSDSFINCRRIVCSPSHAAPKSVGDRVSGVQPGVGDVKLLKYCHLVSINHLAGGSLTRVGSIFFRTLR